MILRLGSPAARWVFLGVSAVLAGALSYFSARNAWAEHRAGRLSREGLERATQLEPGNARHWYLLGRYWQYNLDEPDNARAIAAYRQAVKFNPRFPAAWLNLGEAYEAEGNSASAREMFLEAKGVYPISAEAAWRYGNFLLRQGELPAAFVEIRHAVEEEPSRAAEAVSRCWRVAPDIQRILDEVLPPARDVYLDAVKFLTSENEMDAALAVWTRLVRLQPKLKLKDAHNLMELLLQRRNIAAARAVWSQALELSGTPRPVDPANSLIWDGGFETDVDGTGFSWRIQSPPGTKIHFDDQLQHSGARALSIRFDGTQNVYFEHVCQFVAVEPGTAYEFSAWIRTEALTTDKGAYFHVNSLGNQKSAPAATSELRGTEPWTRLTLRWSSGKDARLAQVCLARSQSQKLDNQISGIVWIDDVALTPVGPAAGAVAKDTR